MAKAVSSIMVFRTDEITAAGIFGGMQQTATDTDIAVFKEVFDTNLVGVVRVTQALTDLLRKSPEPRIVNVTSGLASLAQ